MASLHLPEHFQGSMTVLLLLMSHLDNWDPAIIMKESTSRHVTDCIFSVCTIFQPNTHLSVKNFFFQKPSFFSSLSVCRITLAALLFSPLPPIQDRHCYDAPPWNIAVVGMGKHFPLDKGTKWFMLQHTNRWFKGVFDFLWLCFIYITYAQALGVVS